MTYKEKYGTLENYLAACAKTKLDDINQNGYLYYSYAYGKHINLLLKPECHMTLAELKAKEKAVEHMKHLEARINGNINPTQVEIEYWNLIQNTEIPEWRTKDGI